MSVCIHTHTHTHTHSHWGAKEQTGGQELGSESRSQRFMPSWPSPLPVAFLDPEGTAEPYGPAGQGDSRDELAEAPCPRSSQQSNAQSGWLPGGSSRSRCCTSFPSPQVPNNPPAVSPLFWLPKISVAMALPIPSSHFPPSPPSLRHPYPCPLPAPSSSSTLPVHPFFSTLLLGKLAGH